MITEPMLAGTLEDMNDVVYPCYVTPKLDGLRILKVDDKVLTRKFLDVPNLHIRKVMGQFIPNGMDGEIMPGSNGTHADIQSRVRRIEGEPKFVYHIFDYAKDDLNKTYLDRMVDLREWFDSYNFTESMPPFDIELVLPRKIDNSADLLKFHDECVSDGYEGIMIRSAESPYKCGRSSLKEGYLLKYKHFHDSEAIIIGFQEKLHNDNPAETNAFGRMKRSKKKEGMVPANTLGAFILKWIDPTGNEVIFHLGSGLEEDEAQEIWNRRYEYLNKKLNFKYQRLGSKGKPLHASFQYIRDEIDI